MVSLEKNIIKLESKDREKDKELAQKIGSALDEITKDIYCLFIHPVRIIKKYAKGYAEMFREWRSY